MAKITGKTTETSNLTIDPIASTSGVTYYKQAKGNKSSGLDENVAAQVVAFDSSSSTITAVAAGTAAGGTVLASNTARLGATISNGGTAIMYLALGTAASSTRYTATLAGSSGGVAAYYEVPFGYTGVITGQWAAANGSAFVTELT